MPVSEKFTVMVDYAHNAMSLKSLLTTIREYEPKRLICLFGCGGNRSRDRLRSASLIIRGQIPSSRQIAAAVIELYTVNLPGIFTLTSSSRFEMGEISSRYADLTVVTTDNPRYEKPEDIIEDIIVGVKKSGGAYIAQKDSIHEETNEKQKKTKGRPKQKKQI